jgi:hypothetical protein
VTVMGYQHRVRQRDLLGDPPGTATRGIQVGLGGRHAPSLGRPAACTCRLGRLWAVLSA